LFCHKVRNSADIKGVWKSDNATSYNTYISASIDDPSLFLKKDINYKINGIVDLCLSCHDMSKHAVDGHPFYSNVFVNDNKYLKLKIRLANDGKILGKLKLYDNNMTCTTCHDPHESNFKLLTDLPEKLCGDCHDK